MKSTLQELVQQFRSFTLLMLDYDNHEMYLWAPSGTSNHMLWHAGHALWVLDLLCVQRLTGNSELPEGWERKFGQHCDPVASQTDWPKLDRVAQLLSEQQTRLLELIEQMTDAQLTIDKSKDQDLVGGIIHALHDEAKHHGEMYLLYKQYVAQADAS